MNKPDPLVYTQSCWYLIVKKLWGLREFCCMFCCNHMKMILNRQKFTTTNLILAIKVFFRVFFYKYQNFDLSHFYDFNYLIVCRMGSRKVLNDKFRKGSLNLEKSIYSYKVHSLLHKKLRWEISICGSTVFLSGSSFYAYPYHLIFFVPPV